MRQTDGGRKADAARSDFDEGYALKVQTAAEKRAVRTGNTDHDEVERENVQDRSDPGLPIEDSHEMRGNPADGGQGTTHRHTQPPHGGDKSRPQFPALDHG